MTESPGGRPSPRTAPLPPDRTQAILEATKEMAARLKAGGHPFALAGSVAAYAHGVVPSFQHDVDFCITPQSAPAVAETLAAAGMEVRRPPEDWLLKARCLGQDIDLIFELADRPVDDALLERAEVMPVESVRMPVLTATDLLASLLRSFSEHHCDFGSVLPVARALREKADWAGLRREYGAEPMPAAFLFLLERLDIIAPGPGAGPGSALVGLAPAAGSGGPDGGRAAGRGPVAGSAGGTGGTVRRDTGGPGTDGRLGRPVRHEGEVCHDEA